MIFSKITCFICLIYVTLSYPILAQNSNLDDLKNKVAKVTLIDTLAVEKHLIEKEYKWLKLSEIDANDLDFDLKYRIDKERVDGENYYILLIWQRGKIIYREIFTIAENLSALDDEFLDTMKYIESTTIYLSFDSFAWKKVQQLYQNTYNAPLNIEELRGQSGKFRYEFGYAFGGGAEPNEQGMFLIKLVQTKNKEEILKWASSLMPERQAYGYIGLLLLQKKGIVLTSNELKMMNFIAKKSTFLEYGYGCTGFRQLMQMKDALNEEMIKAFTEMFSRYIK